MSNACIPSLVGAASSVSEILLLLKMTKFPFGCQKIESNRIGSINSCKWGLMSNACTPSLVGAASLVLEILLLLKMVKFP